MPAGLYFAIERARTTPVLLNIATIGDNIVVVAGPTPLYLWKLFLVAAGTVSLTFKDGATPLSPPIGLVANGSLFLPFDSEPWFTTTKGNALVIGLSANVQVSGVLYSTTQGLL